MFLFSSNDLTRPLAFHLEFCDQSSQPDDLLVGFQLHEFWGTLFGALSRHFRCLCAKILQIRNPLTNFSWNRSQSNKRPSSTGYSTGAGHPGVLVVVFLMWATRSNFWLRMVRPDQVQNLVERHDLNVWRCLKGHQNWPGSRPICRCPEVVWAQLRCKVHGGSPLVKLDRLRSHDQATAHKSGRNDVDWFPGSEGLCRQPP